MRSKQEMMDLILNTAKNDPRIRAVIMNGSRVNPNAPVDIFQDYDIIYVVTEVEPYVRNLDWISRFGERLIVQMPDDMDDLPRAEGSPYAYLMQFADGNRIDLTIYPLAKLDQMEDDSLSLLLLDKDGIIPPFEPPSERTYLPQPPTAKHFAHCCNEFWWVAPYVAKGLWRQEFPYARHMFEVVREGLMQMITWHIGMKTDFQVNPGKNGKYFRRYLSDAQWDRLVQTYADGRYEHTWDALDALCDLFHQFAVEVAQQFGFDYPQVDETRVWAFLRHIRTLPRDAKEIY